MERRHFLGLFVSATCSAMAKTTGAETQNGQTGIPSRLSRSPLESSEENILYLLTYDHGGLILWGKEHFRERLRNAATWLDRYPSFKIGLDNEAYTYDRLAEQDPPLLDEIRALLRKYQGRLGIGTCTYGQPLSHFINEESNIRQIGFALEADRKYFGRIPPVYLMSEHAMHSQIPQILVGFGFQGAIMRTHYMMYGYNPNFDVPIGWWMGVDGSKVATVPTYVGEGAEFGKTPLDNWILTRYPSPESKDSLEVFRAKFKHIKPLLASRADDSDLRREELVRQYEGKPGYRWILLEELRSQFPPPTEEMKTVPNDFKVRMPWGYCGNEIWNHCRMAEVAVLTAERMAAIAHWYGGETHETPLESAWKNLLIAQHHDIQICGLVTEARQFLSASVTTSKQVQESAMDYAASQLSGGETGQITVFNPHSWVRREWLTADLPLPRGAASSVTLRFGEKIIPSIVISAERSSRDKFAPAQLALLAEVPPLSFLSYSVHAEDKPAGPAASAIEWDSTTLQIRTPFWMIGLDPKGGMRSIMDQSTGKNLLQQEKRSGFFAGTVDAKAQESLGVWTLMPGPNHAPWLIAREQGTLGGIPYTLDLTLCEHSPRLDYRVTFRFNNQQIGRISENKRDDKSAFIHEEKLRFKIFPALECPVRGIRDLPFVISESDQPYVEGIYWMAVADSEKGFAWFNRGNMGAVIETDGGWSIPLAYAMYYIWGTRMLNGEFTYEFALYPFQKSWQEADLHRRALEYNFSCLAHFSKPGNGSRGNSLKLIEVGSDSILLTALYTKKGATYARFWEHTGQTNKFSITALGRKANLIAVDLLHHPLQSIPKGMSFRPWEFRTLRIDAI